MTETRASPADASPEAMTDTLAWADHRIFATSSPDEGALLFGADHASLFAIDARTRDVLSRWRSRDEIVLPTEPGEEREVLQALCDARVLVPSARARPPCLAPIDPAAVPLATLVLEVAQACNLRCTYCYAGGGTYGGESRLMSPEVARSAARFLVESSGDRGQLTLVLFGGEPLLNVRALEAAVLEAERAAGAAGKSLTVSLTTNGTRFTPEVLEFLRDHRIGVSVSIDGPPDVHDANRRHAGANGSGSYADVIDGLAQLRASGCRPPAARVTLVPSQWGRVREVFEHLLQLGFAEVGIAPASPTRAGLLPTPTQDEALFTGFADLAAQFVREATQGRVLAFSNLLDLLARLHLGRVKQAPCGAGVGYLAADAQGRFFLCHRFTGEDSFRVGDLDRGIDHDKIRARLSEQAAVRADDCAACWARSLCAGGCHYDNHLREVTLGLAAGGSCDFIRRWLELGIRVYADLRARHEPAVFGFLARRAES